MGLFNYFFWTVVVIIGMVVPFIFCVIYFIIGIRQWAIGNKENNDVKQKGAIKIISITLLCSIAIAVTWWQIISNFFELSINL